MSYEVVFVERRPVSDAVGATCEGGADGQCDIFGSRVGAKHTKLTHGVVSTSHTVDKSAVRHPAQQVGRCRPGSTGSANRFSEGETGPAVGNKVVDDAKGHAWDSDSHCSPF